MDRKADIVDEHRLVRQQVLSAAGSGDDYPGQCLPTLSGACVSSSAVITRRVVLNEHPLPGHPLKQPAVLRHAGYFVVREER
jgi:hypothetical protein